MTATALQLRQAVRAATGALKRMLLCSIRAESHCTLATCRVPCLWQCWRLCTWRASQTWLGPPTAACSWPPPTTASAGDNACKIWCRHRLIHEAHKDQAGSREAASALRILHTAYIDGQKGRLHIVACLHGQLTHEAMWSQHCVISAGRAGRAVPYA